MEYSIDELQTPLFGYNKDNETFFKELLRKKTSKNTKDISQYIKNKEKSKKSKTEKRTNKERSNNKSKEKKENRNKEKNKDKYKSPNSKQKAIS